MDHRISVDHIPIRIRRTTVARDGLRQAVLREKLANEKRRQENCVAGTAPAASNGAEKTLATNIAFVRAATHADAVEIGG